MAKRKSRPQAVPMEMLTIASLRVYQDQDGSWHFFVNGAEVSAEEFHAQGGSLMDDSLFRAVH